MAKSEMDNGFKADSRGNSKLQKLVLAIEAHLTAWIAGGCLLFIMLETTIDVFGRYFFKRPISGTVEITEMLMVLVVFLGISYTQKVGLHVKMAFFLKKLQGKKLIILRTWNALLGLTALLTLAISSILEAVAAFNRSETTAGPLFMSAWPFSFLMFLGVLFLVIRLVVELVSDVADLK